MDIVETNEKILTKEEKREKIYDWALKALWVGVNALLLVAYLTGFCITNGTRMTAWSFIGRVRDVFSMRWIMWYYYLGNCAHAIIYVLFGVKNLLEFKDIVRACFSKKINAKELSEKKSFWTILLNCVSYFLLASSIAETKMTGFALFACILALVAFAGEKILAELLKEKNLSLAYLLQTGVYVLAEGIILLLLGSFLVRPLIASVIEAVDIIFTCTQVGFFQGLYYIYKTIVVEILYAILIFAYFALITNFLGGSELQKMYERESLFKKALIVIGIDIVAFILFIATDSTGGVMGAVRDYFGIVRTGLLQIALLAVAEKILSDFPKFAKHKKATKTESNESNESVEINA